MSEWNGAAARTLPGYLLTYVLTYVLAPHLAGEDERHVGTETEERVVLLGLVHLGDL